MKKRPITIILILIITFFFSMINVKAECSDGWLVECYYVTTNQEHVATIRYKKGDFRVEYEQLIGIWNINGYDINQNELDAAYDESSNGCLTNLYYNGSKKLIFANHYKYDITVGNDYDQIALFESKSCLKDNDNNESSGGNSQNTNVELNIPHNITCDSLLGNPNDPEKNDPAFYLLIAFKVIKYVSIALLVVLSTIDFIGAIASSDKDILTKTVNKILKRFILCIVIFLLPTIIEFILQYIYNQSIDLCGIK